MNIYASSVFCYDKHKKNFDIHFSMKRPAWRMSRLLPRLFWIPPCCVFKTGTSQPKRDNFLSINIRIEFYLFVSHEGLKDRGSTCKFRKALRALRNLHVDPLRLCHSYLHEKQKSRIQSLNKILESLRFLTHLNCVQFQKANCKQNRL